jgi:hypothetical protein
VRAAYRTTKAPIVVGGLALLLGYTWAAVRRVPRPVSAELMHFHRQDQMKKLRAVIRTLASFKKPDAFRVAQRQTH